MDDVPHDVPEVIGTACIRTRYVPSNLCSVFSGSDVATHFLLVSPGFDRPENMENPANRKELVSFFFFGPRYMAQTCEMSFSMGETDERRLVAILTL